MMKVLDICEYLDGVIPASFQESYDNSGLQTGEADTEINSALISLDVTEEVIDEAIAKGCGMIITHHPLIFHPLRRVTGKSDTERILIKAIRKNIAIYSAHTNLDVVPGGVSRKMAGKLSLENVCVLAPLTNRLMKLVAFVPESHISQVREAVFGAGAGVIGNYDSCSFNASGTGTFRGNDQTKPFSGEKGKLSFEPEVRFETILFTHLKGKVIKALLTAHPYEEVAYDLYPLDNEFNGGGMGCLGELPEAMQEKEFLKLVSGKFGSAGTRHSILRGKPVRKVAVCGGAGISLLDAAISSGADAFVTADARYHDFFRAGDRILLADIGHFESEKFSVEILYDLLIKKFPTFALRFSEINTNPINYI